MGRSHCIYLYIYRKSKFPHKIFEKKTFKLSRYVTQGIKIDLFPFLFYWLG